MRAAAYTPEVLVQMGWTGATQEPVVTLPNGRALHRWPSLYLTPEVVGAVSLARKHRAGLVMLDGPASTWPAWTVDALASVESERESVTRSTREASDG